MEPLYRLLRRAEVDRAVAFNLLNIATRVAVAPLTAFLIGIRFSPEEQGFYFTFYSLVTMQVLVELGLSQVLIQFASHEVTHLKIGPGGSMEGDPRALARLNNLARYGVRWYLGSALVVLLLLTPGGVVFFSRSPHQEIAWLAPWLGLCGAAALRLCFTPFWAVLEGCNLVAEIYRFRFVEGLLMALTQWLAILGGAGLWVPCASVLASVVWGAWCLLRSYPGLLRFLARPLPAALLAWQEVRPMQWRMAITWISSYLTSQLFTPVTFHYWGPVLAGQVGMACLLSFNGIGPVAGAWINSRAPRFGILIARRDWGELDRTFARATQVAVVVSTGLTLALAGGVWLAYRLQWRVAHAILPPEPAALFLLAAWVLQLANPLAVYLRAHKQEPLAALSLVYALALTFSTWLLGARYGPTAMALGFLVCSLGNVLFTFLIWRRRRREWHAPTE